MESFLDTLCVRNKQRGVNFNQSEEAMSGVTASVILFRDMTTDFRENRYSKNSLICDCVGESTHAITTLLSISLSVFNMSFHSIEQTCMFVIRKEYVYSRSNIGHVAPWSEFFCPCEIISVTSGLKGNKDST